MSKYIDQFSELLSNPLGDLISSIGRGVGEAQSALDAGSLTQTLEMYREDENRSPEEKRTIELMREIGYQPTFYTIPETECEAQVYISLGISGNEPLSPIQSGYTSQKKMYATPLNAGNINRYNLNANASAKLKFKIVPVPTDAIIAEMRILPNLETQILPNSETISFTFKDAKLLLESLGLNYKLAEGVMEEEITNQIIRSTIPKYNSQIEKRLRVGDVVELIFE
jgi:hypothetical protein